MSLYRLCASGVERVISVTAVVWDIEWRPRRECSGGWLKPYCTRDVRRADLMCLFVPVCASSVFNCKYARGYPTT